MIMKIFKCKKCSVEIITAPDVGVYRPDEAERKKMESGEAVLLYTPMKPLKCLKCGNEL